MTTSIIDTLARATDTPSGRRNALGALGLAAVAAMAGSPLAADAKKNNKKKRRRKNRNQQECPPEDCTTEAQQAVVANCQAQAQLCEARTRSLCEKNPQEEACLEAFLPCCQPLETCNFDEFFFCYIID